MNDTNNDILQPNQDGGICPACGAPIPDDAPSKMCPSCLAARIMMTAQNSVAAGSFTPPSIEEVQRLIPSIEIEAELGHGGMGAVYKGVQTSLNRAVAVKLLPLELSEGDPTFKERFHREAETMARLSHQNIVTVYDFGETAEGHCYIVMEYIEGLNLHQMIHGGKITPAEAMALIPQICDALQFAHDRGVIHRDIKPANILVDTNGGVKLTDFGLAKLFGDDVSQYELTMADVSMGTPYYVAPEQARHEADLDHRVDIYSLGVVLYELLTGQVPRGAFELPSKKKVEIDVRLDEVVIRAMQSERELRYQQVSEIKTRVDEVRSDPVAVPKPAEESSSKGRIHVPMARNIAIVAVLLLGVVLAWKGLQKPKDFTPGSLAITPSDHEWSDSGYEYTENSVSRDDQASNTYTVMQKEFAGDLSVTAKVELQGPKNSDGKGILIQGGNGRLMISLDDDAPLIMWSSMRNKIISQSNDLPIELDHQYKFQINVTDSAITATVDGCVVSAPNLLTGPYKIGVLGSGLEVSDIVVREFTPGNQETADFAATLANLDEIEYARFQVIGEPAEKAVTTMELRDGAKPWTNRDDVFADLPQNLQGRLYYQYTAQSKHGRVLEVSKDGLVYIIVSDDMIEGLRREGWRKMVDASHRCNERWGTLLHVMYQFFKKGDGVKIADRSEFAGVIVVGGPLKLNIPVGLEDMQISFEDLERLNLLDKPVFIENVHTKRYLFSDGKPIEGRRGAEGGWKAISGFESPKVVGADANYEGRACWKIIKSGRRDIFHIENCENQRWLFSDGPVLKGGRGLEGGWLAHLGFESPSMVGADGNYYNRALWKIYKVGDKFIIENCDTKRYLFSAGKPIEDKRGAEGGWLASTGFQSPKVVGTDANYENRAYWRILPQQNDNSDANVISHKGSKYQLIEKQMTWHQARDYCERMGGHLVIINSQEEFDFVTILASGHGIWLGGSDAHKEGDWRWLDGTEFKFAKWLSGEPNNSGNEDYVVAGAGHWHRINNWIHEGLWNDAAPTHGYYAVCEWSDALEDCYELKAVAQDGDVESQYALANIYYNGSGVMPSYSEAFLWYQKAADQGHAIAPYRLGECYAKGEGVEQDLKKAEEWLRKAAEQGHQKASEKLDEMGKAGKKEAVPIPNPVPARENPFTLNFGQGSLSKRVAHSIVGGESDGYTFRAKAGQRISTAVTSLEDDAVITILHRKNSQWAVIKTDAGARVWHGRLPKSESGIYKIMVGATDGNTTYELSVGITALAGDEVADEIKPQRALRYIVVTGDTYPLIAEKQKVSEKALRALNNDRALRPGVVLDLPVE